MHRVSIFLVVLSGCGFGVTPVDEVSVESSGIEVTESSISSAADSNWPWWRGPSGNGIVSDQPLPTSWDAFPISDD